MPKEHAEQQQRESVLNIPPIFQLEKFSPFFSSRKHLQNVFILLAVLQDNI